MRIVCPMCKRVIANAPPDYGPRPFCSPRCKLADLDNWLSESYRISSPLGVSEHGDGDAEQSSIAVSRAVDEKL